MKLIVLNCFIFAVAVSVTFAAGPLSISQNPMYQQLIEYNADSNEVIVSTSQRYSDHKRTYAVDITNPVDLFGKQLYRIFANIQIHPIPKDELSVFDPWDRAGDIRLEVPGKPDIELVKFITAYGGETEYDVELSYLRPILTDTMVLKAFIDTWVQNAWKVDVSLSYEPIEPKENPDKIFADWVEPLWYEPSVISEMPGKTITVTVPENMKKVLFYYYVSGHCTDGRDEDEFISKDNVIRVDEKVVFRYQPWRDDCGEFRTINPYTKRWSDGYWSSDFSRSGWCPGDKVEPLVLDLSDHLTPGTHTVSFSIEDIRPEDENGNYGYWRVSGYLAGYDHTDIYFYNED